MSLQVVGNTAVEAAIGAHTLNQGEIGKVVTVDNHVNAKPAAVNCFIVRGSKYDAEGAMLFAAGGPCVIKADHLHLYRVVKMPQGFELKLRVQ